MTKKLSFTESDLSIYILKMVIWSPVNDVFTDSLTGNKISGNSACLKFNV